MGIVRVKEGRRKAWKRRGEKGKERRGRERREEECLKLRSKKKMLAGSCSECISSVRTFSLVFVIILSVCGAGGSRLYRKSEIEATD